MDTKPVHKILIISTTNLAGGRIREFERMLRSVEAEWCSHPINVRALLLLQNYNHSIHKSTTDRWAKFATTYKATQSIPLSSARNILLKSAFNCGLIQDDTIVLFPDDDAWYTAGLFAHLSNRFRTENTLDLWFCRYSTNPRSVSATTRTRLAKARDVVRYCTSNTIVLRGRIVLAIGAFDEDLGLGTLAYGSEDTDYALAAFRVARRTVFVDGAHIGHRVMSPSARAAYYPAGLEIIARYARLIPGLKIWLLRKVLIGLWLVLKQELPVKDYLVAIRRAASYLLSLETSTISRAKLRIDI